MKKFIIILIPIILLLGAVGGFFIWYYQPINRIERAFEKEDYQQVTELYSKLKKDEHKEAVQDRLIEAADVYRKDYLREKTDYKDVVEFYDLVTEEVLYKNRKMNKYRSEIDEVYASRNSYADGEAFMKKGMYTDAIMSFSQVSEIDEIYYERALASIEECRAEYVDQVLASADSFIALEQYEDAQAEIVAALDIFPEDNLLISKMNEILELMYANVEGKWCTAYDFGELIASELGLAGHKLYFPAELVIELIDGKMHMYVTEESIKPALDEMTADKESMDTLYVIAEQYGVNKFEADILVTLMYGGSYAAFIMDQYGSEISSALASFDCEADYFADSKKIYVGTTERNSDNYYAYEQTDSSLRLTTYNGMMDPLYLLNYPITLVRKLR